MAARSASVLLLMFPCLGLLIASFFTLRLHHFLYWFLIFFSRFCSFYLQKKSGAKAYFLFFFCCLSPILYSLLSFLRLFFSLLLLAFLQVSLKWFTATTEINNKHTLLSRFKQNPLSFLSFFFSRWHQIASKKLPLFCVFLLCLSCIFPLFFSTLFLLFFALFWLSFWLSSSSFLGQQRHSIYSLYTTLIRKDSMH